MKCDICRQKHTEMYDAKTKMGPWGFLCKDCFFAFGVGLGLGKGTKLKQDEKEKGK